MSYFHRVQHVVGGFKEPKRGLCGRRQISENVHETLVPDILLHVTKIYRLSFIAETKLCLSAINDKRYILDDGVHTLAYGHHSLN